MLAVRRPGAWACYWLSAIGVALAASIGGAGAAVAAALALGAVLLVTATDGHVPRRWQQIVVAATLAVGAVAALLESSHPGIRLGPLLVEGAVLVAVGLLGFAARCRTASPLERARLQWLGWSLVVAATVGLAALGFDAILAMPHQPGVLALGAVALVPLASVLATYDWAVAAIDRILVRTIVLAGLVTLVVGVYLVVVLGLGHAPTSRDRDRARPLDGRGGARRALLASRRDDGSRSSATAASTASARRPTRSLRTFGSRLSRAIPMDELLLQVAESLRKTPAAPRRRGVDGLGRACSSGRCRCPTGVTARIDAQRGGATVVARAGVSGHGVGEIWLPAVAGRPSVDRRAGGARPRTRARCSASSWPCARADSEPFTDDDDPCSPSWPARWGWPCTTCELDSALQESLDEVRRQADELRASRARIVAASDAARRQIERNLHDGAQQHLVALAVNVRLARQLAEADPERRGEILEQLRRDAPGGRPGAAGAGPRHLPAAADRPGHAPRRCAAAADRAALAHRGRGRGLGRYPRGRRGRGLLLLPRGDAERGQARRRRRRRATVTVRVEDDGRRSASRCATTARASTWPAARRGPRLREHERPGGRHRRRGRRSTSAPGRGHDASPGASRSAELRRPAGQSRAPAAQTSREDVGAELLLVDVARRAARAGVGGEVSAS